MVKKSPVDISHLAALSSSDSDDEADVFQKVKRPSESEVAVAAPVVLKKKKSKKEKDVNASLPGAAKVEESKVTEDAIASKKKKKKKEKGGDGESGQSVFGAPKLIGKTKGSSETTASALSSADSHNDMKSTKTGQLASPVPKKKKKGKKERALSDSSADNTPKSSESIKETPGPLTALSDSDSEDGFSEPKKGIAPAPVPPKKEIVAAPAPSKKKKNKKEKAVSDSSKIVTPTSLESVREDATPLTALSDSESENELSEPQKEIAPVLPKKKKFKKERTTSESSASKAPKSVESNPSQPTALSDSESENEQGESKKEIAPVPVLPKKKKLKKERTTSESSASKTPKSVESNPSQPTALSDSESENELSEPQKEIAPVPVLPKKKKLKKERTTSESSASKTPKSVESIPSKPTALSDSESENELSEPKKVVVPAPPSPKKKKNKKEKAGNESSTSKPPKSKSVESNNKEASQMNALSSSESENELKKESQKEVPPIPVSVKKKKVKKEKAVDVAAPESSLPSDANRIGESKAEEAPPVAKKKKKKLKEGKGSHSVASESESISEKQSLVSPKSKLINNAADMNFTSSDVGSQESPTKRTVRDIIDTLESSSSSDEETPVPVLKSPKKSPKKVRKDSESKTESMEISVVDGQPQPSSSKLDSSPKKSKKKVKTESKSKAESVDASVGAHHVRSLDMSGSSPSKSKKRKHRRSMSEESLTSDKEELSKPRKADLKSVTIETPEIDSDEEVSAGEMIDPESGDILPAEFPVTPTKTQADPKSSSESEEEGEEEEEEEEEATSEEDVRTETAKQLRYKAENFKEVASFKAPWLEELRSKDKELWLIKVPGGSDVSFLNGQSLTWDKKTVVNAENNENESFQSVWEISARSIPEKQGVNLTALVPSKKNKMFHSVGQIAGQITVTKGVKVPEYVMPQTGLKILPKMPQGLKRRHQPFGADAPLNAAKDDGPHSKLAKKKKKDKKHKIEGGSTLDTSLKKKKKKEKH